MKFFLALAILIAGISCKPIDDSQPRRTFASIAVAEMIDLLKRCIVSSVDSQLTQTTAEIVQKVRKCVLPTGYFSKKGIREKTAEETLNSLKKKMSYYLINPLFKIIFPPPYNANPLAETEVFDH